MNLLLALQLLTYLRHRLKPAILLLVSLAANLSSSAQSQQPPPPSLLPQSPSPQRLRDNFYPYAGVFCGLGGSTSPQATRPTAGCGVGFTFIPLPFPLYTEVGVMGPQANRSSFSGYVSVDTSVPLAKTTSTYLPVALFGYSRLFETGHALDYGLALIVPKPNSRHEFARATYGWSSETTGPSPTPLSTTSCCGSASSHSSRTELVELQLLRLPFLRIHSHGLLCQRAELPSWALPRELD